MSIPVKLAILALGQGTAVLAASDTLSAATSNLREFDVVGNAAQSAAPTRRVDSIVLGVLGSASWQETPFSIQTITAERLRNQQGSSLTDVLKAQPSVQSQTGGSRVTDYFTSRGFTSSVWTSNTSVEGLLSHNPVEPVEDKERVEVMNGPNSFLYGVTSPGGMVNSVLKRPTDTVLVRGTVGDYGGAQAYGHADVGGPVAAGIAYRANLLYVGAGSTGVEDQTHLRYLASGSLDWKVAPALVWSVDASLFHRDVEHSQCIWMIGTATKVPDAPDASKNWGSDAGFAKDDYVRAGTRLSWQPFQQLKVHGDFRYNQFSRQYVLLRRVLSGDTGYTLTVNYQGRNRNLNPQADLLADLAITTGPVKQVLSAGYVADYLMTEIPTTKATATYNAKKVVYANDAAYPVVPRFDTIVSNGGAYAMSEEVDSRSAILLDRVSLGRFLDVYAGLNFATIKDHNVSLATGRDSTYDEASLSPSAAVVVTPWPFLSLYASYIQALQRGPTAPNDASCLNANQTLKPYLSHQFEGGIKASLGGLALQVAAFRIVQPNSYNDSVPGTKTYVLTEDGSEVHTGVEVTAVGKLLESLSLSAGMTFIDASIEKSSTASLKDKAPQGVAETMGKFGAEWALPFVPGLFLNGTVNYTGKEWVNTANTLSIPSVVTGDAGIRYELPLARHLLALRASVTNLTGEDYWTTRAGILYLGDPRTFIASAEYTW